MRFIIMGLPKTGKTMLVHTLNRINGFRVLGEIFNTRDRSPNMPVHPQKIIEDMRIRDQKNNLHTWYCKRYNIKKYDVTEDIQKHDVYKLMDEFLNDMIFLPDLHCGFKLHHHHIELTPQLKDWIIDNNISIIHCDRDNKIKQAIAAIGNRARGKKFYAKPEDTEKLMIDNKRRFIELRDWFKGKVPYMYIKYETLTGDTDSNMINISSIKAFFKVHMPLRMNVLTRKNTKDKVSENLINYDEFYDYFKGTYYEKWID